MPQNKIQNVASIFVGDRYIIVSCARVRPKGPEPTIFYDSRFDWRRNYTDVTDRDAFSSDFTAALSWLKDNHKDIQAITIGCCVSLRSSLTEELRSKDSRYGVIGRSSLHPKWEGFELYSETRSMFPEIAKRIFVRADTSLGALGEYFWRLSSDTHHLSPLPYYKKATRESTEAYRKNLTLTYIKFSTEVNLGTVYNGRLLGGLNHPFAFMTRPQLYQSPDGRIDGFKGCSIHGNCISGLISVGALRERLREAGEDDELNNKDVGHWIWKILAFYAAQLVFNVMAFSVPSLVILEGRTVRDFDNLGLPKSDLVNKVWNVVSHEFSLGKPEYPYIDSGFQFVQEAACPWPVLYGGLVFGAQNLNTDNLVPFRHRHEV